MSSVRPILVVGLHLVYRVHRLPGSLNCTLQSTLSYEFVTNREGAEGGRQFRNKSKAYEAFRPLRSMSAHKSLLDFISVADESLECARASRETTVL